jgi:multiple sugar transport system substrate-binding protein
MTILPINTLILFLMEENTMAKIMQKLPRKLSRREFLRVVGVTGGGLALAACATKATEAPAVIQTEAPAVFDWKKYAGKSIRMIDMELTDEDLTRNLIKRFTEDTGIEVVYERYEQAQARQKIATEFTAGSPDLQLFFTSAPQDGAQYVKNGWYEDLQPYINNPSLTSPDYDFADFSPQVLSSLTKEGKLIGMPILVDCGGMWYLRDLFKEKGLALPTNFDELEQVAKALHDPDNHFYGVVARGQASASVSVFSSFLHNSGADWFTNGLPSVNTPEAVAAYDYYGSLLRNYGPPGVVNMGSGDTFAVFGEGNIGMYLDAGSFMPFFKGTKVEGKIGFAKVPAGKLDTPLAYSYGIAMSSQANNKEAAWYLIQWITSKKISLELQIAGNGSGRNSSWNDPSFTATADKEWVDTNLLSFKIGNWDWLPPVISIPEARDIVGAPIVVSIEGGDVQAAADEANQKLTELAKRDGVIS